MTAGKDRADRFQMGSWRGAETGRQKSLVTPYRSPVSLMLVMHQCQTGTDSLVELLDGIANHRATTAANRSVLGECGQEEEATRPQSLAKSLSISVAINLRRQEMEDSAIMPTIERLMRKLMSEQISLQPANPLAMMGKITVGK